jgi:ATP-dependent helicase HrpB
VTQPREPLPIDPVLPQLAAALATGHAVLSAPTGSGKTTGVPLALLDAPWLAGRSILMLEPRRPAARMAAARMADLLSEPVGERIGHQVRFERRIGPRTRVEVLTEAILTRRLQSDPELRGCGLVIFDEFHERSLNADLGLALALDATALRPDLRILVMSATLDTAAVSRLLGGAPVIEGSGRAHPVTIRHAERTIGDPVDALPAAVRGALSSHEGDVLAFLPGAGEINQVAARLADLAQVEVLPLHGGLSLAAQERALRPVAGGRRRVVLATDIAETSLTIEGISVVVDSGLARKPRFEPGSGLTRLITAPISKASADQRAGRAGRLGPGLCIRLWTSEQEQRRPAHRPAEMLEADLAPLVLELALWGVSDPNALAWLDPPPAAAWAQATDLLRTLDALDARGGITAIGRRMAWLPLHPRLARMLSMAPANAGETAADLAALLSERDPWAHQAGLPRPTDLTPRLHALQAQRLGQPAVGFDARRLTAIRRLSDQFRHLQTLGMTAAWDGAAAGCGADSCTPGALLALAYPERIARNRCGSQLTGTGPNRVPDRGQDPGSGAGNDRGRDERFLLASGTGARLPGDDALALEPWLVIADLEASSGDNRIRAALPISEAEVHRVAGARLEHNSRLYWDAARESVSARDQLQLGAIVLESRPAPIDDQDAALALLLAAVAADLKRALSWTPAACQLQARTLLARRLEPGANWPNLSDTWLAAHLADWLGAWLTGKTRLADARALNLAQVLGQRLGWQRQSQLESLAPEVFITPAGTRRRIDYCDGDQPVLAVPMQELFGVAETPAIFEGQLPLQLHLLSPAGRPLQVTGDLSGFWRGAYAEVRKEMRGRYPKHHWPEHPASARPVAGGLKRHVRDQEAPPH